MTERARPKKAGMIPTLAPFKYTRTPQAMKTAWNGNLAHNRVRENSGYSSGCNAICKLAGKTAISSAINPQAAQDRQRVSNRPPSPISHTPLKYTRAAGNGK